MTKAPFYRVYIDGDGRREISEQVEGFIFEDTVKEDNLLHLTIRQDYAATLADDETITTGTILLFEYGFIRGDVSAMHRARITDVMPKYNDRITLDIVCLDLGTEVKRAESNKVWKNQTSFQIAEAIAKLHGLDFEGDVTSKVWDLMPQGNKNNLDFLRYLAKREDGGNYQVYIRDRTLYFTKRNTTGNSLITYAYGDPDGGVISFTPSIKESGASSAAQTSELTFVDPVTGEIKKSAVDNDTEAKTGTTGSFKRVYNSNGVQIGVKKIVVAPTESNAEAVNVANNEKKNAVLSEVEGRLEVEGNPLLVPDNIITMTGVGKRFAGNWYVTKVITSIDMSGYKSALMLSKNGLGTGAAREKATDANTDIGADVIEETVKIRVYDENGKFVRFSTSDKKSKKAK